MGVPRGATGVASVVEVDSVVASVVEVDSVVASVAEVEAMDDPSMSMGSILVPMNLFCGSTSVVWDKLTHCAFRARVQQSSNTRTPPLLSEPSESWIAQP